MLMTAMMFAANPLAAQGITADPVAINAAVTDATMMAKIYPTDARSQGHEGDVLFEAALDRKGSLISCSIIRPSGFDTLDRATCRLLAAYGHFKPLTENGKPVAGFFQGFVGWRLPDNAVKIAAAALDASNPVAPILCKRRVKLGSMVEKKRTCFTRKDWDRMAIYAQEEVLRMQMASGPFPW